MNLPKHFKYQLAQAKTSWQLVVLGIGVGLLASTAIILLRLAIEQIQHFYMGSNDNFTAMAQVDRLLMPLVGALIILLFVRLTNQKFHRMGIPFVLHRQRKFYGYIPLGN